MPLWGYAWRCERWGRSRHADLTMGNDIVARVVGRIEPDRDGFLPAAFGAAADDTLALFDALAEMTERAERLTAELAEERARRKLVSQLAAHTRGMYATVAVRCEDLERALREIANGAPEADPGEGDWNLSAEDAFAAGLNAQHFACAEIARAALAGPADDAGDDADSNTCDGCGGGIDRDHPTTCSACLYERATGRVYEQDVDEAHRRGMTFEAFAREQLAALADAPRGPELSAPDPVHDASPAAAVPPAGAAAREDAGAAPRPLGTPEDVAAMLAARDGLRDQVAALDAAEGSGHA